MSAPLTKANPAGSKEVQAEGADRRTTKLLLLLTPLKGMGLWGNEFMVVCDLLGARLGVD